MTFEKSHRKHYAVCSTMAKDYKKLLYQMHQESKTIKKLNETYGTKLVIFNSLATISVDDRNDKKDYLSIMKENINLIKQEVFE